MPAGESRRPVVVVTVAPQAYFVQRLAGDQVEVVVMLPPGASPETYEPTIQQMKAITRAALYVKVGHPNFPFEQTWLDRLLAEAKDMRVVDCAKRIEKRAGDPHLWVSPAAARTFVPDVAAALAQLLPDQRTEIESREASLRRDIDRVDSEIRGMLANLRTRRFYVYHPAWGYFAADYGLEQVPIEVGAKEPDPRRLAALIARAKSEGTQVIFAQPQFSQRSAELVASEIGARVVVIDPLARDWLENLLRVARALRETLSK